MKAAGATSPLFVSLPSLPRQPTMTIMALAFRAADHIASFAKRGEI